MNVRAVIPLVAGLGIGGLALKLGISTLKQARAGQKPVKVAVWAAKEDVPRGTEIREEMLNSMEFPAELVPPGSFQEKDKDKLLGRMPRLVAPAGLPILDNMLAPPGCPPGVNPKPGFRAVAVNIDAGSGVDYHLEPGAFVDVVGSFRMRNELIAKTIVENAEVAAVGPRLSPASGKVEEGKDKVQTVRAVTLFVHPEDVKAIALAEQTGKIKLSLRGNDDSELRKDEVSTSDRQLLGIPSEKSAELPIAKPKNADEPLNILNTLTGRAPTPPPPPPQPTPVTQPTEPTWTIRIHNGDKTQFVQFKNRDSLDHADGPQAVAASQPLATAPVKTAPPQAAERPVQPVNGPAELPGPPAPDEPQKSPQPKVNPPAPAPQPAPEPQSNETANPPVEKQAPAEGKPEREEPKE